MCDRKISRPQLDYGAWKTRPVLLSSGLRPRQIERPPMITRREHDLLGDRDVPADAYYGVHTLRAVENFPISGTKISIYPDLVAAPEEVRAGKLHEEFVVDVIQGGAGTSTNMNANEVIANRALELLGRSK